MSLFPNSRGNEVLRIFKHVLLNNHHFTRYPGKISISIPDLNDPTTLQITEYIDSERTISSKELDSIIDIVQVYKEMCLEKSDSIYFTDELINNILTLVHRLSSFEEPFSLEHQVVIALLLEEAMNDHVSEDALEVLYELDNVVIPKEPDNFIFVYTTNFYHFIVEAHNEFYESSDSMTYAQKLMGLYEIQKKVQVAEYIWSNSRATNGKWLTTEDALEIMKLIANKDIQKAETELYNFEDKYGMYFETRPGVLVYEALLVYERSIFPLILKPNPFLECIGELQIPR